VTENDVENAPLVKQAASRPNEKSIEIAQPMNDVFGVSFESKFDPYFRAQLEISRDRDEQGGAS